MDEIGKVIKVESDQVKVQLSISDHCKHCSMSKFCIITENDKREIIVKDTVGVKVGDIVKVRTSSKKQLLSILLVFGLPIVLGVFGLFVGNKYGDKGSLLGGLIGLGVGLILLKIIENAFAKEGVPEITEICEEEK